MPEIILCATQRCGSTMILEDMRNTDVLGQPEEWFIPWDPDKEDANWKAALQGVKKRATGANGVMSIKVMANQLADIEACLRDFLKPPPGPLFFRFHKTFENASWVWLKRQDIVAQAVSRIMAQQTGVSHATDGTEHFAGKLMRGGDRESYNAKANYNYEAILKECTSITLENLAWQRFFETFDITPLTFNYEDVAADPTMAHLDAMAEAVGIEKSWEFTERSIVKLGNSKNTDFVKRFHSEAARGRFRAPPAA